jgi:dGTPase
MLVCSYVSGMSDSYAIRMHKKLTGNISWYKLIFINYF